MRRRADRRLFGGNAAEVGPGKPWWEEDLNLLRVSQGQLCSLRPNRVVTSREGMRRWGEMGNEIRRQTAANQSGTRTSLCVVGGGFEPP